MPKTHHSIKIHFRDNNPEPICLEETYETSIDRKTSEGQNIQVRIGDVLFEVSAPGRTVSFPFDVLQRFEQLWWEVPNAPC